jgi:hypothetical protein
MVLLFVPIVAWAKYGTGITAGAYWDSVKRPLISGAIGGGAGWLVQFFFHSALAPVPLLALELTVSFAVYGGLLLFIMGQKPFYVDLAKQILKPAAASPTVT